MNAMQSGTETVITNVNGVNEDEILNTEAEAFVYSVYNRSDSDMNPSLAYFESKVLPQFQGEVNMGFQQSYILCKRFQDKISDLLKMKNNNNKSNRPSQYKKRKSEAVEGVDFHVEPCDALHDLDELAEEFIRLKTSLIQMPVSKTISVKTYLRAKGRPSAERSMYEHSRKYTGGKPPNKYAKEFLSADKLSICDGAVSTQHSDNQSFAQSTPILTQPQVYQEPTFTTPIDADYKDDYQSFAQSAPELTQSQVYQEPTFTTPIDGVPSRIISASIREVEEYGNGIISGYNDFPDMPVIFNQFSDLSDEETEDDTPFDSGDDKSIGLLSLLMNTPSDKIFDRIKSFLEEEREIRFNYGKSCIRSSDIRRIIDDSSHPHSVTEELIDFYIQILNEAECKRTQYMMKSRRILYLPLKHFKKVPAKQTSINIFCGYFRCVYVVCAKNRSALFTNIIILDILDNLEILIYVCKTYTSDPSSELYNLLKKTTAETIVSIKNWIYYCSHSYGVNITGITDADHSAIHVKHVELINFYCWDNCSSGLITLMLLCSIRAWSEVYNHDREFHYREFPSFSAVSMTNHVCFELINKKVIDWNFMDKVRDYNIVRMLPSLASGNAGGSPLDTLPRTLPLLIHKIFQMTNTYGLTTIKHLGGGGNFENFNICLAMQLFQRNLLYLTFELTYCNEVKKNAVRGIKTYPDASFDNMLYVMGVSYEAWTPCFQDCSRSLFITTAIIPPLDMAQILSSELRRGTSHFIIPERNKKLFKLLRNAQVLFNEKIPVKLCVSNETLLLMMFVVHCKDAFLLYSDLVYLVSNETDLPAQKVADLKKETAEVVKYNHEMITRSRTVTGNTSFLDVNFSEYGKFDEEFANTMKNPKIIIKTNEDGSAINHRINEWVIRKRSISVRSPFWPRGFANVSRTMCHFIACTQLVAVILANSNVNYTNDKYPCIEMFMHLYVHGMTELDSNSLYDIAQYSMGEKSLRIQQCAFETMQNFFLSDSLSSDSDWTISQTKFRYCSVDVEHIAIPHEELTEPLLILSLSSDICEGKTSVSEYRLQELIAQSFNSNEKQLHCSVCKNDAFYCTKTSKFPDSVLVLPIVRWDYREKRRQTKSFNQVRIRMTLKLDVELTVENDIFVLIGAIYHQGKSSTSGHFKCLGSRVKKGERQYFLADDDKIIDVEGPLRESSTMDDNAFYACIAVYTRKSKLLDLQTFKVPITRPCCATDTESLFVNEKPLFKSTGTIINAKRPSKKTEVQPSKGLYFKWDNNSCPFDSSITLLLVALKTTPAATKGKLYGTNKVFEILTTINDDDIGFDEGKIQLLNLLKLNYHKGKRASFLAVSDILNSIAKITDGTSGSGVFQTNIRRQSFCTNKKCDRLNRISEDFTDKMEFFHSLTPYLPSSASVYTSDLNNTIVQYLAGGVETGKTCAACNSKGALYRTVLDGPSILFLQFCKWVEEKKNGVVIDPFSPIMWGSDQYRLVGIIYCKGGNHFISRFIFNDHCIHYDGMLDGGYIDLGAYDTSFFAATLDDEYGYGCIHDTVVLARLLST